MWSQSRKVTKGTALCDFREGEYSAICYFTTLTVSRLHGMINERAAESYDLHNHRCENLKSYEYGTFGEVRIGREIEMLGKICLTAT
jgi:hypothetical protein